MHPTADTRAVIYLRGAARGVMPGTGTALGVFAAVAVAAGEPAGAARLWGAAQAIFDVADYKLDRVDQDFVDRYVGEVRAALGAEAYEAAFRGGSNTPSRSPARPDRASRSASAGSKPSIRAV